VAKHCCKSKQSNDVIFFLFSISWSQILIFAVLIATVGAILSFNILCKRFTTVVFQLVQVTHIMKKSLDGLSYNILAILARAFL
jgi:hypothetical protein